MLARHSAPLVQGQLISQEEARARLFNAQPADVRARLENMPWAPGAQSSPVIQGTVIPNPAEYTIHSDHEMDGGAPHSTAGADEVSPAQASDGPSI